MTPRAWSIFTCALLVLMAVLLLWLTIGQIPPVTSLEAAGPLVTNTPPAPSPSPTPAARSFVPAVFLQDTPTPGPPTDTPEPTPTVVATNTPPAPFP